MIKKLQILCCGLILLMILMEKKSLKLFIKRIAKIESKNILNLKSNKEKKQ